MSSMRTTKRRDAGLEVVERHAHPRRAHRGRKWGATPRYSELPISRPLAAAVSRRARLTADNLNCDSWRHRRRPGSLPIFAGAIAHDA